MPEVIEVFKDIRVEANVTIRIDYVACDICKDNIEFTVEYDNFGDLQIYTEPHTCD